MSIESIMSTGQQFVKACEATKTEGHALFTHIDGAYHESKRAMKEAFRALGKEARLHDRAILGELSFRSAQGLPEEIRQKIWTKLSHYEGKNASTGTASLETTTPEKVAHFMSAAHAFDVAHVLRQEQQTQAKKDSPEHAAKKAFHVAVKHYMTATQTRDSSALLATLKAQGLPEDAVSRVEKWAQKCIGFAEVGPRS